LFELHSRVAPILGITSSSS